MRKFLIFKVVAAIILLTLSFSPAYPASFPRHKNPAQIQEETFFPLQLISLYGEVVRLQVVGKWDLASSELKKVFFTYIPEPLRYIFTRLNELIQVAGDKLKIVKEDIDSAEALLRQGEIEKAGKVLEKTWITLLKAKRDIDNLNSSVDELKGRIGAGAADRLRQEIAPLSRLADDYTNRIQNLYREVREGKRLESTFLEISVAEKKVMVGGSFEVYGRLEAEGGKVLAGRNVDIFLEGKIVSRALTGKNGEFKAKVDLPFLYKRYVQVLASFIPQGKDREKFYSSTSNRILLEPVFYAPLIEVSYEEPVYPVLPFRLEGKLTLEGLPLVEYPVKIKAGQRIIQVRSDSQGRFQTRLSLPAGAGRVFPLSVFTPPRGAIAPASLIINIPVTYKVPSMVLDLPLIAAPPFPLELKGEVELKGDVMKGAMVRVVTEKKDVTTTVKGKSFKVKFNIPLLRFSGWERINVFLRPREAWILSLDREEKVLVINPFTLLPIFSLLAIFIGITRKKEKKVREIEGVEKKEEKVAAEEITAGEKEIAEPVRIYLQATDLVAHITGIHQALSHTIREYLELVRGRLEEKEKDFEFISFVAEKFLYAPGGVSEEEVKEVEKRFDRLVS